MGSFYLAPNLNNNPLHFGLRKFKRLIEHILILRVVDWLLLSLIIQLSILQDKKRKSCHAFWPQVIDFQCLDLDIQRGNLHNFTNFDEWAVNWGNFLLFPIEYLHSLVGHVWPVKADRARAHKFISVKYWQNEFRLLVVPFKDGVAVVALLVGRDEVGVDLFLCFAYLYSEGGDVFKVACFYANSVQLSFFHY